MKSNVLSKTVWYTIIGLVFSVSGPEAAGITVDGGVTKGTVPHFWEECVGCGSMEMCMRNDVKAHFKMAADELGMKRVRGHGMIEGWLNPSWDKMGIFHWDGTNKPTYNWKSYDSVIKSIKNLGMQPAVELSFCPRDLRSISSISSCQPKNYDIWRDLVYEIVKHTIERWGLEEVRSWYWEVWNEPDIGSFWEGTNMNAYYKLYDKAVEGALKADSLIRIGGPVTSNPSSLQAFVDHCKAAGTKISFLANHHYAAPPGPTADPYWIINDNRTRYQVIKKNKMKMGSVNSEWNTTYTGQGGSQDDNCKSMDSHYNAPFAVRVIKLLLDDHTTITTVSPDTTESCAPLPDLFSYWVISDIFDEGWHIEKNNFVPFGSVFGMITYHGIPKAVFNGLKMLHKVGTTRLSLDGGSNGKDGVDGFATLNRGKDSLCVIIYNCYNKVNTTGNDEVDLTINNLPFAKGKVRYTHFRVDETHSNPYKVWVDKGKPTKPTTEVWDQMRAASKLAEIEPQSEFDYTGAAFTKKFTLPRQGLSLIILNGTGGTQTVSGNKGIRPRNAITVRGSNVVVDAPAGDRVSVTLHGLDGKVLMRETFYGKQSIDAGCYRTAGGFCIVRAETGGQCVVKKVHIP